MSDNDWRRVNRQEHCPICDHSDWCLVTGPEGDPDAAICMRIADGGVAKETSDGTPYYLHALKKRPDGWKPPKWRSVDCSVKPPAEPRPDIVELAREYQDALEDEQRAAIAGLIGVCPTALDRLGMGFKPDRRWFSFPMTGDIRGGGRIVGIRLRQLTGKKLSVKGGKEGLFLPSDLQAPVDLLLILEGPTDTAAALTLGFDAVGRPSCCGGVALLVDLVGMLKPAQVVIVADADGPGRRGAETLASKLAALVADIRVIEPPQGENDMREWVQDGATKEDVLELINAAPKRTVAVSVTKDR